MTTTELVARLPKVELHVHLEGSIRPETVLQLAARNGIELPAKTLPELKNWFQFRDFPHFVEVYVQVSKCIRTPEDIEFVAREFVDGQAMQNVLYTEATYTASTLKKYAGIAWEDQLAALQRARTYAQDRYGMGLNFIIDLVRGDDPAIGEEILDWVSAALGNGVVAMGLTGEERLGCRQYAAIFERAAHAGVPVVTHTGETMGADSIREAWEVTRCRRIAHGVRCLEDPALVAALRDQQVPLDVCPSSNVCLGVVPSLADHPLPDLLAEGLVVTVNSDDPPMFSTTLSRELEYAGDLFDQPLDPLYSLTLNAARSALISEGDRATLIARLRDGFNAAEEALRPDADDDESEEILPS